LSAAALSMVAILIHIIHRYLHGWHVGGWVNITMLIVSLTLLLSLNNERLTLRYSARLVMTIITVTSATVYIVWRTTTLSNSLPFSLALYAAELFGMLQMLVLLYTLWPREEVTYPTTGFVNNKVYALIPVVGEGRVVIEPTVRGVIRSAQHYRQKYPEARFEVVICNDGYVAGVEDWQDMERLAEEFGVTCITRTEPGGAKAGNIEHARQLLKITEKNLLAVFDCDQVPEPEFFEKMLPPFLDDTVGWVQTGQYYRNTEYPVAYWADRQNDLFFNAIMTGKNRLNAVIICGTNFIIRASALDSIGGFPQDSITEDMAASVLLNGNWRSIFIHERLVYGLGPMSLDEFFAQQRRWATGNIAVGVKHIKEMLLGRNLNMTLPQRVQYLSSTTYYISGIVYLLYTLIPIVYLITGISSIDFTSSTVLLWHSLPFWVSTFGSFLILTHKKMQFRGVLMSYISFPTYIMSLITVLTGRKIQFRVTSKAEGRRGVAIHHFYPHLLIILLAVVALLVATVRFELFPDITASNVFWLVFQMAMLSGIFLLWLEERQFAYRRRARETRFRLFPEPVKALYAAVPVVLVMAGFTFNQQYVLSHAVPEEIVVDTDAQYVITLHDPYVALDVDWLQQMDSQNQTPWIVFDFTQIDAPVHMQNALPITNGLHDEVLRERAQEVLTYNIPVIITLNLDDSLQYEGDTSQAWGQVRQIFAQEGADKLVLNSAIDPMTLQAEQSIAFANEDVLDDRSLPTYLADLSVYSN